MQDSKRFIQVEEIAQQLAVPRHFMGKILKKLVKAHVLSSSKGKTGGFAINNNTMQLPLVTLVSITDGFETFHQCALSLQECSARNPCPIHDQMNAIKDKLNNLLSATTLNDLIKKDKEELLKSITTVYQ